jgi:hypothetical protein
MSSTLHKHQLKFGAKLSSFYHKKNSHTIQTCISYGLYINFFYLLRIFCEFCLLHIPLVIIYIIQNLDEYHIIVKHRSREYK